VKSNTGYTLAELFDHIDDATKGFDPTEITVLFDAMDDVRHDNSRLPTLRFTHLVAEGHDRATLTIIPQGLDVMAFAERTPSRRTSQ